MSSSIVRQRAIAADVWLDSDMLCVRLTDGRELGVPLELFLCLRQAGEAQRNNWRLIGDGMGIRWEELDEDISVAGLLRSTDGPDGPDGT